MLGTSHSFRRAHPRIAVETLCSEIDDSSSRNAIVVDLSASGLRVQRPVGGAPRSRLLQLEFEIPEVDEIVWATGEICFDEVWSLTSADVGGLSGLLRTSGIRLLSAADRHKKLLREYVNDLWLAEQQALADIDPQWMFRASCYRRG